MNAFTAPILLYHSVCPDRDFRASARLNLTPEGFRAHLAHLKRRLSIVSLERALAAPSAVRPRAVAVTFDDGYGDTFRWAWPILRATRTPATVFLTVSQVGREWETPRGRYPGISWAEAAEMGRDPLVEFGSHGLSHRNLPALAPGEAAREIALSKALLEEKLGRAVRYFSYPHGAWNAANKAAVAAAGYQAAFSVISRNEDRFSLRRVLVSRYDGVFRLRLKLSPLYWPLRRLW